MSNPRGDYLDLDKETFFMRESTSSTFGIE